MNFDLLLYWTIIFSQREGKNITSSNFIPDDGFRKRNGKLIWTNNENNTQNIFYLHGGLHLFIDNEYECYYKRLYDSKKYSTIIKQFKKSLDIGNTPFVVIGGNSDDKLKQISEDKYLHFCYSKLKDIKGDLFIHGHSLNKVDEHIFDIINANNNIKTISISIHEPFVNTDTRELSENAYNIMHNANNYFGNRAKGDSLNVNFYDASTTQIWRDK